MTKAIWNGRVLAESTDIVTVEGNLYFPRSSLKPEFFRPSGHHTTCSWKGLASYLHIDVGGQVTLMFDSMPSALPMDARPSRTTTRCLPALNAKPSTVAAMR